MAYRDIWELKLERRDMKWKAKKRGGMNEWKVRVVSDSIYRQARNKKHISNKLIKKKLRLKKLTN
jgi:predicted secreted protein